MKQILSEIRDVGILLLRTNASLITGQIFRITLAHVSMPTMRLLAIEALQSEAFLSHLDQLHEQFSPRSESECGGCGLPDPFPDEDDTIH